MQEQTNMSEEQILMGMNQHDFEMTRKSYPQKYKAMLKSYMKLYQPTNLQEIAMSIIKKPGEERNEDEISILQQWTNSFKFFQELNSKSLNVELKLHQKCCGRIKYEKVNKGQAVFMAGDIPEKFYIILSGAVNVMLPKSQEQMKTDIAEEKQKNKLVKSTDVNSTITQRIYSIKEKREQQIGEIRRRRSKFYDQNFVSSPNSKQLNSSNSRNQLLHKASFQLKQVVTNGSSRKQSHASIQKHSFSSKYTQAGNTIQGHQVNDKDDEERLNYSQDSNHLKHGSFSRMVSKMSPHKKDSDVMINQHSQLQEHSFTQNGIEPLQKSGNSSSKNSDYHQKSNQKSISVQKMLDHRQQKQESQEQIEQNQKDANQSSEELIDEQSQIRIDEFQFDEIEKDPTYILLGNLQAEALQDLDAFFQEGVAKHKYLLTLKSGSMFGELGLLMKKPRAATILAQEDTEFAVLNADDYSRILFVGEMKQINEKILFFSQNFLQGCGREIVNKYSYNFESKKFTFGNTIYSQGDPSKCVYIIKKGLIEISQTRVCEKNQQKEVDKATSVNKVLYALKNQQNQAITRLQKEVIRLSVLSVGQCFGEIEILKNTPRITDAKCVSTKVTLWVLPSTKLITENKFLNENFLNQIKLKESWYQKQEVSHDLQKEVVRDSQRGMKKVLSKQELQKEVDIRKEELSTKLQSPKVSYFKGDDEEIEKLIKLEILEQELLKDIKALKELKKIGAQELIKKQQMEKIAEYKGVKKQIQYNLIQKNQNRDQDFEQQVFNVMKKIQYQKKEMQDLLRKITIKNAQKYMPKKKFNEYIGLDIKHALNLQIFQNNQKIIQQPFSEQVFFFFFFKNNFWQQ